MDNTQRRDLMLDMIIASTVPLSGGELSRRFEVSRQVIVQDIAYLRAKGQSILSTNKGYIYLNPASASHSRVLSVSHNKDQIGDELNTIIDYGGRVVDVSIRHSVYGRITVDLKINSRRDVADFLRDLDEKKTRPLMELTGELHSHTVVADSEESLDRIALELKRRGYLAEESSPE